MIFRIRDYDRAGSDVSTAERHAVRFRAEQCDEKTTDKDGRHESAHGFAIREHLAEGRLDVGNARGAEHAELIGEPGKESAQVPRRELVDVSGDDAPGALDEELHEEHADERR